MCVGAAEREPEPPAEAGKHRGQLHPDLEQCPNHRAPGGDDGKIEGSHPESPSSEDERGDLRGAPDHRRDVAEEEPVVAVEDAEAERGEDEERGPGKEDADEQDGERALVAREPGSDGVDEIRRRGDAHHRERGRDEAEQPGDGAGDLAGFLLVSLRAERRVDGDEGGAENAFPEQVLEEVGNLESGVVRVRRVGGAEVVTEDALPDEPRETAEKDPRRDEPGLSPEPPESPPPPGPWCSWAAQDSRVRKKKPAAPKDGRPDENLREDAVRQQDGGGGAQTDRRAVARAMPTGSRCSSIHSAGSRCPPC